MADDLRNRIAAAMRDNGYGVDDENRLECADMLIRELNLAESCESGCVRQISQRIAQRHAAASSELSDPKLNQPVNFTSQTWGTPSFDNGTADE